MAKDSFTKEVTFHLTEDGLLKLAEALEELAGNIPTAMGTGINNALEKAGTDLIRSASSAVGEYGDVDGNEVGTTSIRVNGTEGQLDWQGKGVGFYEFGYGYMGAADPYPGDLPGWYTPDPEKTEWTFGAGRKSHSLGALAPMYLVGQQMRLGIGRTPAIHRVRTQVRKYYPKGKYK